MCRLTLCRGPAIRPAGLVTEPVDSIIHQSFHGRDQDDPLNGDGFGLACYVPELRPGQRSGVEHLAAALQRALARGMALSAQHGNREPSHLNLALVRGHGCMLISSEPLSDDPSWGLVPRNSIVRAPTTARRRRRRCGCERD